RWLFPGREPSLIAGEPGFPSPSLPPGPVPGTTPRLTLGAWSRRWPRIWPGPFITWGIPGRERPGAVVWLVLVAVHRSGESGAGTGAALPQKDLLPRRSHRYAPRGCSRRSALATGHRSGRRPSRPILL